MSVEVSAVDICLLWICVHLGKLAVCIVKVFTVAVDR